MLRDGNLYQHCEMQVRGSGMAWIWNRRSFFFFYLNFLLSHYKYGMDGFELE